MELRRPLTMRTPRESSSIDWDKLDEMEPDEAQASQEVNLPSAPRSGTPVTDQQLLDRGYLPDQLQMAKSIATMGDLQTLEEEFPPKGK